MKKVLAIGLLILAPQIAQAEGMNCQIFHYDCRASVGEVTLELYDIPCDDMTEKNMSRYEKDHIYTPYSSNEDVVDPEPRVFECKTKGNTVKVALNYELPYTTNQTYCLNYHQYIPFATWWVNDQLVAKDMYFNNQLDCLEGKPEPTELSIGMVRAEIPESKTGIIRFDVYEGSRNIQERHKPYYVYLSDSLYDELPFQDALGNLSVKAPLQYEHIRLSDWKKSIPKSK